MTASPGIGWLEVASVLTALVTAIAAVVMLFLFQRSVRAEHKRQQKQATIEHLGVILRDARARIDARYGFAPLTAKQVDSIYADNEALADMRNVVGAIEHLCVGIRAGVFDARIVYRMTGNYLLDLFERLERYIIRTRQETAPSSYTEFESVVHAFKVEKRSEGKPTWADHSRTAQRNARK